MKSKALLLLILTFSALNAAQIPFYAKWQSLHTMYYDTLQSGKELSWDESYRSEFGLKRLSVGKMDLSLELYTEQFFDEARVLLQSIRLGYESDDLYLQVGSATHGYGTAYAMNSYPLLENGFDPHPYQSMRLNSLGISGELTNDLFLRLDLGGNKHNQATGMITLAYLFDNGDFLSLHEDLRVMDSHWRTPVSITGLEISRSLLRLDLDGTFALSLYPEWEATEAHADFFGQTEVQYQLHSRGRVAGGMMYLKQNYAPKEKQQYHLRYEHALGNYRIIPISNLHLIDQDKLWQHRLMAKYQLPLNASSIGVYYDYSYYGKEKPRHTIGLALDFELDVRDLDTQL